MPYIFLMWGERERERCRRGHGHMQSTWGRLPSHMGVAWLHVCVVCTYYVYKFEINCPLHQNTYYNKPSNGISTLILYAHKTNEDSSPLWTRIDWDVWSLVCAQRWIRNFLNLATGSMHWMSTDTYIYQGQRADSVRDTSNISYCTSNCCLANVH